MSDCCIIPHEGAVPTCPVNGRRLHPVERRTLTALLEPEPLARLTPQPYYFCDAPDCDTVYVSALGDHLIGKDELRIRVGLKERGDPVPLCYCFGYERKQVRDDVREKGDTGIQRTITERVRAGECRCEETNPSGGCCLGEVSRAIKEAKAMKAQGLL